MTIELRIHGVGGSTPEGLLGERHPDDVVEVERGHRTGLWARRRDPSVRGYVWGGLTSGAKLQPLWIVLLPFTLVNMAGWMHPPLNGTHARERKVNDIRRLVTLLGFTLTITWSLWLAVIVGDFVFYQGARTRQPINTTAMLWGLAIGAAVAAAGLAWRRFAPLVALGVVVATGAVGAHFVNRPTARAIAGVIAGQAVLGVLTYISGLSRRQYEAHFRPRAAVAAMPRTMKTNEDLRSPVFFSRPNDGKRLFMQHVAILGVVTVVCCARAYVRAQDLAPSLEFGSWLLAVNAVQFTVLIVLAIRSWDSWSERRHRWRFAGPAATAGLGLLLTNAVFTGLALWSSDRFKNVERGAERALADMYVLDVALVVGILLLAWLPYFLSVRLPKLADDASLEEEAWRMSRARRQRLARAFRHIDLIVSAAVAWLVVAGIIATVTRIDRHGSLAPWNWSIDPESGLSPIRGAGAWLLPFLVPAVGILIRTGARSTGARRNIGNLWDVAGLWPRRFHPLAVRPYAERAIPELQAHILGVLVAENRRLVISAHSQGSVLAFVALSGLASKTDLSRVALVTYGSPLGRLHARFFPAYVNAGELTRLRSELHSWRSFFRRTDHIGQTVFGEDDAEDVELPDPAEGPAPGGAPASDGGPFLEPDRTPWRGIAGHNDYPREPALKAWVAAVKEELGRTMDR